MSGNIKRRNRVKVQILKGSIVTFFVIPLKLQRKIEDEIAKELAPATTFEHEISKKSL